MPNYSKNFLTSMTGYVNLNDPEDPKPKSYVPRGKTTVDSDLDVRDLLSNMVGQGYASWQEINMDEDAKAKYGALVERVGRPLATKLVTQAISFNTRTGVKNQPVEQKIQSFYDIGSGDAEVAKTLTSLKALGTGVVSGFRESILKGNQELQGKIPVQTVSSPAQTNMIKEIVKTK
jgi:hypothetical protein